MKARRVCILAALVVLFVGTIVAQGDSNGNGNGDGGGSNGNGNGYGEEDGNNGNGNGNGNLGPNNGNGNGNGNGDDNNGNGNGNGNLGGNNGNGNGNGNAGGNNGNGNGNGNLGGGNGNGNGNGNGSGNGNGNGYNQGGDENDGDWQGGDDGDYEDDNGQKATRPSPPPPPPSPPPPARVIASGDYVLLSPVPNSGQERCNCLGVGACQHKTLTCPSDCPERKPKKNRKQKGCFLDCSSKCQATCKWRKPDCNEKGSICYDPRFVGGDGVMFYFHGSKGNDFAIVSDYNLHINAHFIGNRPAGRTRDFTWVQALSLMFDDNTLLLAANKVSHWDNNTNALLVKWNGASVSVPTNGEAEWSPTSGGRQVVIERTMDVNTVRASVSGLVQMDIRVTPIGEKENRVHHYQLPSDDVFAHLEVSFSFFSLSEGVEGVLGKTYRAGYVSPVKRGVPMPIMGGEDKYRTPSLYSPSCKMCLFQRPSAVAIDVL